MENQEILNECRTILTIIKAQKEVFTRYRFRRPEDIEMLRLFFFVDYTLSIFVCCHETNFVTPEVENALQLWKKVSIWSKSQLTSLDFFSMMKKLVKDENKKPDTKGDKGKATGATSG